MVWRYSRDPRPRRHSVAPVKMDDVILIDIYEYYCMHERLWKSSVSRDVVQFWELNL